MRDSPHTPSSSGQLLSPEFTRFDSTNRIYDGEGYGAIHDASEDVSDKPKADQLFEDGFDIAPGHLGEGDGRFGNEDETTSGVIPSFAG